MNKKSVLFAFFGLLSLAGTAQTKNVDIDNFHLSCAFRDQPQKPMDPLFFNYVSAINAAAVVKNNVSVEELENALFVAGQNRVSNPADADMEIILSLGNIMIASSNVVERKVEQKDKDGKVTSVAYYYKVETIYSFEASAVVKWLGKDLIKIPVASRTSNMVFFTNEYGSRKEAADYWNNNREVIISNFYRELSFKATESISYTVSKNYGFNEVKGSGVLLKITDEKKHNENTPFKNAVNDLKAALLEMTPNMPLDREQVEPLINYFKSIPEKYADNSKADIRLRYAAYYNLCRIYLCLDEPENVEEYANLLSSNGYDAKDGEKLKKEAGDLIQLFQKTGIKSRHFDPEIIRGE